MDIVPQPKKTARSAPVKRLKTPVAPIVTVEPVVATDELEVQESPAKNPWIKRIALSVAGLFVIIVVGALWWYNVATSAVDSHNTSHTRVTIEAGMNVTQIAHILKVDGLIRDEAAFRLYADLTHTKDKLQAGTYLLSPSQSVESIVNDLTSGKTDAINVTILPGKRLDQLKAILQRAGFSTKDIDAAFAGNYDYAQLFAGKAAGTSLEGYVYPDTYQIDANSTPQSLLERTFALFEQKVTNQNLSVKLQAEGLTLYQGITLASIVEQEAKPADRAQVAQVFLLRIKEGMPLGSDVTALYGAVHDGIKLPSDPATAASIAIAHDSPYNTRMHDGLPPGPIANFDISVLEAVANPAPGDYLFFVVGDDGKTYFARTEAEHEQNVQNYCHKLCS